MSEPVHRAPTVHGVVVVVGACARSTRRALPGPAFSASSSGAAKGSAPWPITRTSSSCRPPSPVGACCTSSDQGDSFKVRLDSESAGGAAPLAPMGSRIAHRRRPTLGAYLPELLRLLLSHLVHAATVICCGASGRPSFRVYSDTLAQFSVASSGVPNNAIVDEQRASR